MRFEPEDYRGKPPEFLLGPNTAIYGPTRRPCTRPRAVAIMHCVGSRDENHHRYCSRVCCMEALKFAHLIKECCPEAEVYNFYIDMGAFGKGKEILDWVYQGSPSTINQDGVRPQPRFQVTEGELAIPESYEEVRTIAQVVPVDYLMPRCPPQPPQIVNLMAAIMSGAALPPPGSVRRKQSGELLLRDDSRGGS